MSIPHVILHPSTPSAYNLTQEPANGVVGRAFPLYSFVAVEAHLKVRCGVYVRTWVAVKY